MNFEHSARVYAENQKIVAHRNEVTGKVLQWTREQVEEMVSGRHFELLARHRAGTLRTTSEALELLRSVCSQKALDGRYPYAVRQLLWACEKE